MGQELGSEQRGWLLRAARQAILAAVTRGPLPRPEDPGGRLSLPAGVFVSLHCKGELRGCIGQIGLKSPLYLAVIDAAAAAAREDPRFFPVSAEELPDLEIEISVLSLMEEVSAAAAEGQIEIGRHGLMVVQGLRRGLLLPQVPGGLGWGPREFIEQTCYKAGLPCDAWTKGAQLFRFTAEVFSEQWPAPAHSSST
jgi:AmmeMemoRadiSam system protein A